MSFHHFRATASVYACALWLCLLFSLAIAQESGPATKPGSETTTSVSPGFLSGTLVGTTYDDVQALRSVPRLVDAFAFSGHPDSMAGAFTFGYQSTLDNSDRGIGCTSWLTWDGEGFAYGVIDYFSSYGRAAGVGHLPNGELVIAAHALNGSTYQTGARVEYSKGTGYFAPGIHVPPALTGAISETDNVSYSQMVCRLTPGGDTLMHFVGNVGPFYPAGAPPSYGLTYFRGLVTDHEWAEVDWDRNGSGTETAEDAFVLDTVAHPGMSVLTVDQTGERVVIVWVARLPAEGDCDTCSASFDGPSSEFGDLYYQESLDGGITWQPCVNLTRINSCEFGVIMDGHISAMILPDGDLAIAAVGRRWFAGGPEFFDNEWARLVFWKESFGFGSDGLAAPNTAPARFRTIHDQRLNYFACTVGGYLHNQASISQPQLAYHDNNLYAFFTMYTDTDCSGAGYANGEIYMSVAGGGAYNYQFWDPPRNLTESPTPNCVSGNCWSEIAPSVTEFAVDHSIGSWPSTVLDLSGSYTGSHYLELMFLRDEDAGVGAVAINQEGAMTESDVLWVSVAPVSADYDPHFTFLSTTELRGVNVADYQEDTRLLIVENTGYVPCSYDVSFVLDDGMPPDWGDQWLTWDGASGFLDTAWTNNTSDTLVLTFNAGGQVYTTGGTTVNLRGWLIFTDNTYGVVDSVSIHCRVWETPPDDVSDIADGDCIPVAEDNCPDWPNLDQADWNSDGVGDACDPLQAGSSVEIEFTDPPVHLFFPEITQSGNATLDVSPTGPPVPSGYQLAPSDPPMYYDISVTAEYTGEVEICLFYDLEWVTGDPDSLKLLHWNGSVWEDITDYNDGAGYLCGTTSSLSPFVLAEPLGGCCVGIRGDPDGTGATNVSDLTFLVNYLFKGGPGPDCFEEGDVDATGSINVSDLTYLVNYLFKGGPAPLACP